MHVLAKITKVSRPSLMCWMCRNQCLFIGLSIKKDTVVLLGAWIPPTSFLTLKWYLLFQPNHRQCLFVLGGGGGNWKQVVREGSQKSKIERVCLGNWRLRLKTLFSFSTATIIISNIESQNFNDQLGTTYRCYSLNKIKRLNTFVSNALSKVYIRWLMKAKNGLID